MYSLTYDPNTGHYIIVGRECMYSSGQVVDTDKRLQLDKALQRFKEYIEDKRRQERMPWDK
jgi:ribosomal protein L32